MMKFAAMHMRVARCPTDELSVSNCAVINPDDFPNDVRHIEVTSEPNQRYVFTVKTHDKIPPSCVGFSLPQRKWVALSLNQSIDVRPYYFDSAADSEFLCTIILEADFLQKTNTSTDPYDTDQMARSFLRQFSGQAFTVGQQLAFQFDDKKLLGLVVKSLEAADISAFKACHDNVERKKTCMGRCLDLDNTIIQFEKAADSNLQFGKVVCQSTINTESDLPKMGIAG